MEETKSYTEPIRPAFKVFELFFAITFFYSILKYVIVGDVSISQIPLFIVNKALSWTGTLLLVMSLTVGPLARLKIKWAQNWVRHRKYLGLVGSGTIFIHIFISILLLNPVYYPKFFDTETQRLTGLAQLSFLCGVIALAILVLLALTSINIIRQSMGLKAWRTLHGYGMLFLVLVFSHLAFLGLPSWMSPEKWPSLWLPPITLMAALPVLMVLSIHALQPYLAYLKAIWRERFTRPDSERFRY